MQVEGYVVFYYNTVGVKDKALFLDKERAHTFAAKHYGQMRELVCLDAILLPPESTINEGACSQQDLTATLKPIP